MERKLNTKLEQYVTSFKNSIRDKMSELNFEEKDKMENVLNYVYSYERMIIEKDDLINRKRQKTEVALFERCQSMCARQGQCSRRKKEGEEYCGTHLKGTPHGKVSIEESSKSSSQKVEVWAEDIQGIVYYLDKSGNVYNTEDIIRNQRNPRVIGKYTLINGMYKIVATGGRTH